MGRRRKGAAERLAEYTVPDGDCLMWVGPVGTDGYARFNTEWGDEGKRTHVGHRFFYEHFVGPIPAGMELDHLCCRRLCMNVEHLEPVTGEENRLRAIGGGVLFQRPKQFCGKGHLQDLPRTSKGECRYCVREASDRYRERRRERRRALRGESRGEILLDA